MEQKKNLTREQIIHTVLHLMRDKKDLRSVNLREIARTLGCAHTNLYNYFPSYSDLLWAAHTALMGILMDEIRDRLALATNAEDQLKTYFDTLIEVYLENTGWFRLAWMEYLGDERPQTDVEATLAARLSLNGYIADIWAELTGRAPEDDQVDCIVHTTHCYVIGEISNYLSGRVVIENQSELQTHISRQAVQLMTLFMRKA